MLGHQNMRASGMNRSALQIHENFKDVCMAYILMHTAQTIVTDIDKLEPLEKIAKFLSQICSICQCDSLCDLLDHSAGIFVHYSVINQRPTKYNQ